MAQAVKKPSIDFVDGVLCVQESLIETRVRFTPEPCAEEKRYHGGWKQAWPEFRLLWPEGEEPGPFEAFRQTVPEDLCSICDRFLSHQWILLSSIPKQAGVRELADSNPVLAYALSNCYQFRGSHPEAAAIQVLAHCKKKQKDICGFLGFPDTAAMVRLLRRLRPEAASPTLLRQLRNMLERNADQVSKLLAHRRSINAGVLGFVVIPKLAALCTPKLLDEIETSETEALSSTAGDQVLHSLELLWRMESKRRVRPFHSIQQIRNFVEAIDGEYQEFESKRKALMAAAAAAEEAEKVRMAEVRRQRRKKRKQKLYPRTCVWPPPPIPGISGVIEPLTSYSELEMESAAQSNCISTYWRRIAASNANTYAYVLMQPERCTFILTRRTGDVWRLTEMKTARNRKASVESRRVVEKWLYEHSVAAGAAMASR